LRQSINLLKRLLNFSPVRVRHRAAGLRRVTASLAAPDEPEAALERTIKPPPLGPGTGRVEIVAVLPQPG
jgi:hypothetical protein